MAGKSMLARIAMIAITTSNSINVKANRFGRETEEVFIRINRNRWTKEFVSPKDCNGKEFCATTRSWVGLKAGDLCKSDEIYESLANGRRRLGLRWQA